MTVFELLERNTRAWEEHVGLSVVKDTDEGKLTEEQQAIVDAVKGKFGQYEEDVAKLMSAVTHIPLEFFGHEPKTGLRTKAMTVVRLKNNPNSHNYPLHTPILVYRTACGCFFNSEQEPQRGNLIPDFGDEAYERVTDDDIRTACDILSVATEEGLI